MDLNKVPDRFLAGFLVGGLFGVMAMAVILVLVLK